MNLSVDTSVWSLALRRVAPAETPANTQEVARLTRALERGEQVVTTGLVLQELLQGFSGPKARAQIIEHFAALPLLTPDRQDHIDAAELRNHCRRRGVQADTIDALLAQLCIRHHLLMLSTDNDFKAIAKHSALKLWR